jgi:hypothetical protein
MRLESATTLKRQLLSDVVEPIAAAARRAPVTTARAARIRAVTGGVNLSAMFGVGARSLDAVPAVQRSIALGVAPHKKQYRLAIRVQRQALLNSPLVARLVKEAKGEADVRLIGRVDKRLTRRAKSAKAVVGRRRVGRARRVAMRAGTRAVTPWFQQATRPLLIGASVGHVDITAGTIGAFVSHDDHVCILSNNHVLANEDIASRGDAVIQPGTADRGRAPRDQVAEFLTAIAFDPLGTNLVDAALAKIDEVQHDAGRLRELVGGTDRVLTGLGPKTLDNGDVVFKVGRTTGPTEGRVTAFQLDNVVVNYDIGNLRFDDQVEIEGVDDLVFSDGGDSGSLIVNDDMEAVALLFAGTDSGGSNGLGLTYANPIHTVLDELDATLLF